MSASSSVVDTSVWIQPPAEGLRSYASEAMVSIVTIAELQYGLSTAEDPMDRLTRRRRLQLLLDHYDVLPLDIPTTELYGVLADMVRRHGRNPRPRRFDLLIAATAARCQTPLLTRNPADFAGLEPLVTVVSVN